MVDIRPGDWVIIDDADPEGWGRLGRVVRSLPETTMLEVDVRGKYPVMVVEKRVKVFESADGPRFTDNFDLPDYEAFYLAVTSELGVDESTSVEKASKLVIDAIHRKGVV